MRSKRTFGVDCLRHHQRPELDERGCGRQRTFKAPSPIEQSDHLPAAVMPGNTILNYFSRKKSANASEDKEGGQGTPNATPPRADLKRTLSDSNKDNFGKSTTPVHAGGDSKKPRIEDDQVG